jgi:hypothetical protein
LSGKKHGVSRRKSDRLVNKIAQPAVRNHARRPQIVHAMASFQNLFGVAAPPYFEIGCGK